MSGEPSDKAGMQQGPMARIAVGVDLVERRRVLATYARFGERFMQRVFTATEREQAGGRIERLIGRFVAKEACAKALGTGIGVDAAWQDIEIVRLPGGKPEVRLHGQAAARAEALGLTAFDVSIADTHEHAMAVVVAAGLHP
jgi:holo-[acyl-carrier protein] synthase